MYRTAQTKLLKEKITAIEKYPATQRDTGPWSEFNLHIDTPAN